MTLKEAERRTKLWVAGDNPNFPDYRDQETICTERKRVKYHAEVWNKLLLSQKPYPEWKDRFSTIRG